MNWTALQRLGLSLIIIATIAFATACAGDAPAGLDRESVTASTYTTDPLTNSLDVRTPDLGTCQNLQVPVASELAYHVYAEGVQIYHWNGASWAFDGPSAVLSSDPNGESIVGTHYAGPTWESMSGGTVVGSVMANCTPDASAVAWLLLRAVPNGPGIFSRVAFIQRLNTVGGKAPATGGSYVGEEVRVPYTTEYLFYREK